MGGTNLLMPPIPPQAANSVYSQITERLGLGDLSPSDRVAAITQTPTDVLLSVVHPGDTLHPVLDESSGGWVKKYSFKEIYEGNLGYHRMPGKEWCHEVMIGDCQMDVSECEINLTLVECFH